MLWIVVSCCWRPLSFFCLSLLDRLGLSSSRSAYSRGSMLHGIGPSRRVPWLVRWRLN